jgi:hypothetical protein
MNLFKNKFLVKFIVCGLLTVSICGEKLHAQTNGNGKRTNGKGTVPVEEQSWSTFSSEESGFSVDFPKKPEHVHQTIKVPKTEVTIEYEMFLYGTIHLKSICQNPKLIFKMDSAE